MSFQATLDRAAKICYLPRSLTLQFGGELGVEGVLYEIAGPGGAPAVALLGGISANRHVAANANNPDPGWFESQVGPGKAVDTLQFRVLSFDYIIPRDRDVIITSADHARILQFILDHLQIERLHAVAGASYGAMAALSFCEQFAERTARVAALCGAHEAHPYASGFRAVQREILQIDGSERGVALARALGMLTYRSHFEFGERFYNNFSSQNGEPRFASVDYLAARGADFTKNHSADLYHALSLAIDCHRVDPARIVTPAFLFASSSDLLVPPSQVRELQQKLGGPADLTICDSPYGHDAFLKETSAVSLFLQKALREAVR